MITVLCKDVAVCDKKPAMRFSVYDTTPIPWDSVKLHFTGPRVLRPYRAQDRRWVPDCWYESIHFTDVKQRMQRFAGSSVHLDGCAPAEARLVDVRGSTVDGHGFLQTVDLAYNFHQELVLRPDDIWLLLTMGFSQHVNKDPERYRDLLVAFKGKETLEVETDEVTPGNGTANDWVPVFGEFSEKIRKHIGERMHSTLVADFTTTTPLDRAISEVSLMETFKAYFKYKVMGMCGIPHVVLEGTVKDWESLRRRVEDFAAFGLEWWLADLRPVLDHFVAASRGEADVSFWKRMYRSAEEGMYEPEVTYVSGWVHVFFPYLKDGSRNLAESPGERRRANAAYHDEHRKCKGCSATGPGFGVPQQGLESCDELTAAGEETQCRSDWWCRGCWEDYDLRRWDRHRRYHEEFPSGFRKMPFRWITQVELDCELVVGFAGCSPSLVEAQVRPALAYAVLNHGAKEDSKRQKLDQEHQAAGA